MNIQIEDWYELHKGFCLEIEPGFTALVGPNGAGKTTMLQQIREFAKGNEIDLWEYSNIHDGGSTARERYTFYGDIENLAASLTASEGEGVVLNFSNKVADLRRSIEKARETGRPLIVLLDAIDSGASIDRARGLRELFDFIYEHDIAKGAEVYILMAVNHYELAKSPTECVNVRNGKHLQFKTYDSYAKFICSFEEKFKRKRRGKNG